MFIGVTSYSQQSGHLSNVQKAKDFVNTKVPDSAIYYADLALEEAKTKKDTPLIIRALGLKGKGLFLQKNRADAVSLYFQALKLSQSPRDDDEIAYLYGEVAFAYYTQGHYKEAKEYYYKNLEIRKRLKQDKEIASTLINISVMCRDHKEYGEAFSSLEEVKYLLPKIQDTAIEGYYYTDLGALYEYMKKLDSAAYFYHKAYEIWSLIKKESEIYKITFNIGYLAVERGNHKEALEYFQLAVAAALKFGSTKDVAHVYGTMAESYAAVDNFKKAYEYLYRYAELNDSLARDEFNTHVTQLDKQFQTEKNRQTIRDQELKLKTASLAIQKQRSTTLLIVLVLIIVLSGSILVFIYFKFQNRLNKRVEEAKATFFSNVVHEIRTPLSMIQGPLKVLQDKVTDEGMKAQLSIAERNTLRLNELINQMLDISKLEANAYRLNESLGNLAEFAEQVSKQYEITAQEKGINFSRQIDIKTGNTLFDKDAVEKILGNLLGNAIKYTQAKGAMGINITENDKTIVIDVWDTGLGITKNDLPKIFDRFYRAKEHEQAGVKGIGIGLAMVKDIVALMGGNIAVDSEEGKGTVFSVRLPVKLPAAPGNIPIKDREAGKLILLVEDDKDILDFNKLLLTEKGYDIITATNGNEALVVLKDTLPDLIITDLMMPGMDGLALLKEIRADIATSHIPAIILSAKASAQTKIEGMEEGAQAYLPKPFLPAELTALVNSQLDILEKQKRQYLQNSSKPEQTLEDRFAGSSPFTNKCYSLIIEHLDDAQLSVEKLAELMNINRSHFQRKTKTLTGYSPSELIRIIRLESAKEMLLNEKGNVTEVAYATGFTSQSYFTKCFSEHFGFPPSQLREHTK